MVPRRFDKLFVRGDSEFYQRAANAACEHVGAGFAFVMDGYGVLHELADSLAKHAWKPVSAHRSEEVARVAAHKKLWRKRRRLPAQRARQRGYQSLATTRQWVTEFNYPIPRRSKAEDFDLSGKTCHVVGNAAAPTAALARRFNRRRVSPAPDPTQNPRKPNRARLFWG